MYKNLVIGFGSDILADRRIIPELINELKLRAEFLRRLREKHIVNYKDFTRVAHEFYKHPKDILEEFDVINKSEKKVKDTGLKDLNKKIRLLKETIKQV